MEHSPRPAPPRGVDRGGGGTSTSDGGGGGPGGGGLAARLVAVKAKIKTWEHAFTKSRARPPTREDTTPEVGEMYKEYQRLKAAIEKENKRPSSAGRGDKTVAPAVRSSPRSRPQKPPAPAAPLRDANRRKPTALASRLPAPADSSDDDDDDDDDERIEATPVKTTTARGPAVASAPQRPPTSPMSPPPRRSPRKHPASPAATALPRPSPSKVSALPPRKAAAILSTLDPLARGSGRGLGLPPLVRQGSGLLARGGGGGGGGFARIAASRGVSATTAAGRPAFDPLLCDTGAVLSGSAVRTGAGASRAPESLSSFLGEDADARAKAPIVMPVAPPVKKTKQKAPPMPVYDTSRKGRGKAREDEMLAEPDEDEMLAAMEAEEEDAPPPPPPPADDDEDDYAAAAARASAAAAKRVEAAAAKRAKAKESKATRGGDSDDGGDSDYAESGEDDDEEFEIATAAGKKRRRAAAAAAAPKPKPKAPRAKAAKLTVPTAATEPARPTTGRERADARNAAVLAAAAEAAAKKKKPSGGSRAKPSEAMDWRAAGDEAPDARAAGLAERKPTKKTMCSGKGNFVKLNLKQGWKSKGVKNGAPKKRVGGNARYGGGTRGRRKQAPEPTECGQSLWHAGDWADREKAAKAKERDANAGRKAAIEAPAVRPSAAQIAAEEARAKLEKPSDALASACAAALRDPTEDALTDILRRAFGHESFRPGQLEVIRRVLRGGSSLALLPTGAGKSLTYQLPALLFPGLTLVVSPLLALMSDQLRGLPPALPGAALRSDQSLDALFHTLDELRAGKFKVLFVSPERLLNERFLSDLRTVPGGVSLAVVDEAHCVSEWSHNFRPAYHRLGRILRARLRADCPVLALSATATARTEKSLRAQLRIPRDGVHRNDVIRPNLILSAMRVPSNSREATLLHFLEREPMHGKGSVIVYTAFQNQAETVAAYLQTRGVGAKAYHAGQDPRDRARTQAQFFSGSVRVVVATVAFGMGLDKPDVRAVVNYSLPRSPEAYIQQAGRAGRDGLPARCVSFIDPSDYCRLRSLSFTDGVDKNAVHRLLETVFLGKSAAAGAGGARGGKKPVAGAMSCFAHSGVESGLGDGDDDGDGVPSVVGALVVQQLERELDMRGEVIETVLSCLELWDADAVRRRCAAATAAAAATTAAAADVHDDDDDDGDGDDGLVRVLPDIRATCELSFHGTPADELASQCPLVAAVLAIGGKPRQGKYRFSVAAAARHMRDGLEQVQAQLQALSANGQAAYRLEDRAVGYEIRRAPPTDLRPLSAALVDHLTAVEASAVAKLDTVYGALERAADAEDDASQGASLRVALEAYLGAGCGAGCGADADGAAAAAAVAAEPPQAINTEEPTSLRADARELLSERHGAKAGGAGIMSARAVARVLHGLGSPAFPAQEWRRHRLWERHGSTDFALVMRVASEELLVVRGIKR